MIITEKRQNYEREAIMIMTHPKYYKYVSTFCKNWKSRS